MFVATTASEMLVSNETSVERTKMSSACPSPTDPTTYGTRKNSTRPKIVRMLGVKTPPKVPSVPGGTGFELPAIAVILGDAHRASPAGNPN